MIIISTTTIISSIVVFLLVMLPLVSVLLFVKAKLSPSGKITIKINGEKEIIVDGGNTLLTTLSNEGIFLPSACGGGGTCIQCTCQVNSGGGGILPTEEPHFSRKEITDNYRLSCQVKVKENMDIHIPEEVFGVKKWEATVVSNYNVATYIKEFIIETPEDMPYEAGGYIQIEIPNCEIPFTEMDITAHPEDHAGEPNKFDKDWAEGPFAMRHLVMKNDEDIVRAYSMASYPAEGRKIMLNVRVAAPPYDGDKGTWSDINPGIASSYIFGCKPGDKVTISGPYGEFFINNSEAEMLYIGGGAGMAPMRSHLFHLFHTLKTGRKVSFWYGARSLREMFYEKNFKDIVEKFSNFSFHVAMSEPLPEDNWNGPTGFIHQVVLDNYLNEHEDPTEIEYYLCGPPLMIDACQKMLYKLGVEQEMIAYDSFG